MHVLYALAALIAVSISAASASEYPTQPIRLIVPYPPGTSTDAGARVTAVKLAELLGQTVYIEYRPGSIGEIGTRECANAAPDGYTICYIADGQAATMPAARTAAGHKPLYRQLTPIGFVADSHFVFVTRKDRPRTFAEFVAYAKSNPDTLACGWGNPTGALGIAFFNRIPGVKIRSIPYAREGEPKVHLEIRSGLIDCMFSTMYTAMPPLQEGNLHVLGSMGSVKNPFISTPMLSEFNPLFGRLPTWYGIFGPAGMPSDIVAKLNRSLTTVQKNPEIVELYRRGWHTVRAGTPVELGGLTWQQYGDTIALIKETGVQLVGD